MAWRASWNWPSARTSPRGWCNARALPVSESASPDWRGEYVRRRILAPGLLPAVRAPRQEGVDGVDAVG